MLLKQDGPQEQACHVLVTHDPPSRQSGTLYQKRFVMRKCIRDVRQGRVADRVQKGRGRALFKTEGIVVLSIQSSDFDTKLVLRHSTLGSSAPPLDILRRYASLHFIYFALKGRRQRAASAKRPRPRQSQRSLFQ